MGTLPHEKAIVLLSGGMDSATTLAIAQSEGYETYALSFRYGQRHSIELGGATKVAAAFNIAAHTITDISLFGRSALTGGAGNDTYVPARNTVFLSFALAWAETLGASDIYIGVSAEDYAGYPDCRPEYIRAYERMASLATRTGRMRIHTPLISLTKAQIIMRGMALGVDYSLTHTCYYPDGNGRACGRCESCVKRHNGFAAVGLDDPA